MNQGVTDEYGDLINPPRVTDEYEDLISPPRVTDEYGDLINRPRQTMRNGNYISMIILAVILLAGWLDYENGMTDPNVESPMEIVSADFSASSTSVNAPLTVTFTDQSTGSPTFWYWNFGDGTDSVTEYNPTHTYSTAGRYTVEETVSNEAGEDTEIKTIYVAAESPLDSLSADFSAFPTSGTAPLKVTFTDQSTGSPTSWNWDFGDKITTSTKQNPTHTYAEAGVYTVKETVTNGADKNTKSETNYIAVMPSEDTDTAVDTETLEDTDTSFQSTETALSGTASKSIVTAPVPDFSASVTSGEAPLKVMFTDESSGSPTEWKWNFGDSYDIFTEHNPTHTYTKAGTYTVTETVTNEAGQDMETKTNYITVTAPAEIPTVVVPVPDFSASITSGEAPLTVSFTDESTGSPTEWKWNFGDGSTIIDGTTSAYKNPTHTYEEAGVYEVKETAINSAGKDTEIKTDYITVTAPESDDTTSDNTGTDSGISTKSGDTSLPTESDVLTFVNKYQGVSDFIETVSRASQSDHPEWKWDIWQDQNENKISFYYYQNNPKGYDSIYFDSKGKITSKHTTSLIHHYPGA